MKMYLVIAFGKYASCPFCNIDVFENIDIAKTWADKLYEKYLHSYFDANDTTYIRDNHYHITNGTYIKNSPVEKMFNFVLIKTFITFAV